MRLTQKSIDEIAQRDAKIGNLARNTSNPGEKAAAEKKSKGPKMFGEDWQKVNKSDKTDGMSQKAVNAYRRENPGSKVEDCCNRQS